MPIRAALLAPFLLALAACQQQPTVAQTNASVDAQLNTISAHTNATDGMDPGNQTQDTPTLGQQMDAKEQPPKSQ